MKKYLTGSLVLLTLGLTFSAQAEDQKPGAHPRRPSAERMGERFEKADVDNSGTISLKEMQDRVLDKVQERFTKLDTNKDGEISQEEFKAHRPHRGEGPKRLRPGKGQPGDSSDDDAPVEGSDIDA